MRDHDPHTVGELILALHAVEDELRVTRSTADVDRLTSLSRRKCSILRALSRRRRQRLAPA